MVTMDNAVVAGVALFALVLFTDVMVGDVSDTESILRSPCLRSHKRVKGLASSVDVCADIAGDETSIAMDDVIFRSILF